MSAQCVKCRIEFKSDMALYSHYSIQHNMMYTVSPFGIL